MYSIVNEAGGAEEFAPCLSAYFEHVFPFDCGTTSIVSYGMMDSSRECCFAKAG